MDSDLNSSPSESPPAMAAFRKPSNDAVNRKYRLWSPVSGSSSSDGSPNRQHSSTPTHSRDSHARLLDSRRRKDDEWVDRNHERSQYGRNGDSCRHSDRPSLRSSHNYHGHEDHIRREKRADEDRRNFSKLSPCTRVGSHSDHARRESEHNRSRDHLNVEKYSRDKSDGSGHRSRDKDREASSLDYQKDKDKDSSSERAGSGRRQTNFNAEEVKSGEHDKHKRDGDSRDAKRDYRKTSRDHKSDRSPTYEEPRGHQTDLLSQSDFAGHSLKESSRRDFKELDGAKYSKREKERYYDWETNRPKEQHTREPGELVEDRTAVTSDDQESPAKKPKLFSLGKGTDHGKDASKHMTVADEIQSSISKQAQEFVGKLYAEQDFVKDSDIDAAKIAAMKAAELVNRNLIGMGCMSTDQKKKLLWGSKKSTTTEESTHHWDTSLFSDRERQEKFKKLMGVKGEVKVNKPDNQDGSNLLLVEQQKELQLDLEKQYTAGLRRRDGRTVGLGL